MGIDREEQSPFASTPESGELAARRRAQLLEEGEAAMYAIDRDWRFVEVNKAAEAYFQRPRGELLGRSVSSVFPMAQGTDLTAALRAALETGTRTELATRSPAYPDRFIDVKIFPLQDGAGVWFRNVTKERAAESARLAELEAIYQTAPIGLAMLDRDLRYVRCNERLAEINGVPASEHLGRTVRDLIPELAEELEATFLSVIATGRPVRDREVSGTTSAAPREARTWLENISPMFDESGQVTCLLVSVQEITARKRAEAALAESEFRLRAAQELSLDGFLILRAIRDRSGAVTDFVCEFANRASRESGLGPIAVGARLRPNLADPKGEVFDRFVRILQEHSRDEGRAAYGARGMTIWVWSEVVDLDADRVAISFRDVTQEVRAEQQLRLVISELEHRGRNTLTLIQSMMRLSLRGSRNVDEFERSFSTRLRVLADAQSLITDRPTEDLALDEVTTAALAPFRQAGLRIEGGPPVTAPAEVAVSLILALHELATNALKYGALSQEGGVVRLSWDMKDRRVELTWREEGGPPVSAPQRRGLGSPLITGALANLPGATVAHEFPPEGVVCQMSFDAPPQ